MNSNIQVFNYQDFTVRTYTDENGEVWLVAKDVCAVLGIADAHTAIRDLDDDEKGRQDMPTPGGMQSMTVINEAGLYKLTFRSNKPGAKEFTRKVTHEILPQINHTGSYSINDSKPVVVEQKKKGNLPAHSGGIKAGERLAIRAFKCKKKEDFEAVLAIDADFRDAFGYSWIERHGLKLRSKFVDATPEQKQAAGKYSWEDMQVEAFFWEHDYDISKIAKQNNDNTVDFDEWSY